MFDGGAEDALVDRVKETLSLVEMDAFGGSRSRGYGKVEFRDC